MGEIMQINNTAELHVHVLGVSDAKLEYNIRIGITPTWISAN
jgi:hypothetical protein